MSLLSVFKDSATMEIPIIDKCGWTPLHHAAVELDATDAVHALLDHACSLRICSEQKHKVDPSQIDTAAI